MLRFWACTIFVSTLAFEPAALALGVQNRILTLILNIIRDELNGNLDAESFDFQAPSTVILHKVRLTNRSQKQILRADTIEGTVRLTDLFVGRLTFEKLVAHSPHFDLEIVNGDLDLLSLFKKGPVNSPPIRFAQVKLNNARAFLKDGSDTYEAHDLNLTSGAFDSDLLNIALSDVRGFFKIGHLPISGFYRGALTINDIDSKQGTRFQIRGSFDSASFFERELRGASVVSQLLLVDNRLHVRTLALSSDIARIDGNGTFHLKEKTLETNANVHLTTSNVIFPNLAQKWNMNDIAAQIKISGAINSPLIQSTWMGKWRAASISGRTDYNFVSKRANGDVHVTRSDDLDLDDVLNMPLHLSGISLNATFSGSESDVQAQISGEAARAQARSLGISGSRLSFIANLSLLPQKENLKCNVTLQAKDIKGRDFSFSSAKVLSDVSGTFASPVLDGRFEAQNALFSFGETQLLNGVFAFSHDNLILSKTSVATRAGAIDLQALSVDTKSKSIEGKAVFENLDLLQFYQKSPSNSQMRLSGKAVLSGSLRAPILSVDGMITDLTLYGERLGAVDVVANFGKAGPRLFHLSAAIKEDEAKADLRASYDASTDRINARFEFDRLRFDPILALLDPWVKFGASSLSGNLEATGPLKDPSASLSLILNADRADPQMNLLGMQIGATLQHRKMSFGGCANVFRQYREDEPCQPSVPIKIKGDGTFNSFDDFDLKYDVLVESENFEKISDFLNKEGMSLDLKVELEGNAEKKPEKGLTHQLTAKIEKMNAQLPDDQPMENVAPFAVKWSDDGIVLDPEARFVMFGGDFLIGGEIRRERLNAKLEGKIPLYLLRFLNRNVVETTGMASGALLLLGDFDRPILNGSVKPDRGSTLRFRALPAPIEFRSGEIRTNLNHTDRNLVHLEVDDLKVRVSNGSLTLNGSMDFDRSAENQEDLLYRIDVDAKGKDIGTTLRNFAIEGDLDVSVKTIANEHWVKGNTRIVSGKLFQEFKVDNFEISGLNTPSSDFVWPSLFNRFKTDIDVDLSTFDLDADFGPFEFNGVISGNQLKIKSDLTHPRIAGNLELLDGVLKFPAADFDIPTTPIVLRDTPGKLIDPYMEIKASGELLKEYSGLTQNTSVELTFKRDFDNVKLDIVTTSGERNLGRDKILGILLNMNLGPEILLRPLIAKVEELLKTQTKTRFRIGSTVDERGATKTSVNWRLNPRLELGGSRSTKDISLETEAHFKLKLFDHLPIGKEVSLEGIFSFQEEGSQKLQFNYRLFEK